MEKIEQLVLLSNLIKKYLGMDLENPTNYYDFKRQEELKEMCTVTISLERLDLCQVFRHIFMDKSYLKLFQFPS